MVTGRGGGGDGWGLRWREGFCCDGRCLTDGRGSVVTGGVCRDGRGVQ